ncbi:Cyclic nucleotide-binding domain-containing protein [Vibrio xiamenensis]|uniref:histidine kinase n=2 Tax=Vibrio xiamenensis TaxID=861298 RepID=A0A1G7YIS1_9VIBR|nr:Cyclic nucleotide-binding domain-containing protein [Vibrio xiamenensis]
MRLSELIEAYFSAPERQITIAPGEQLLVQGGFNDRLYYVLEGELEGYYAQSQASDVKLFSASFGAFIGVHSFFSRTWVPSSTVVAKSQTRLAWIDRHVKVLEQTNWGTLTEQFMPVIVAELSQRQRRATQEAIEKERALEKLHLAEQMTTLGQLAAGLAHELNNAIGVVSSKSEQLQNLVTELLDEAHPQALEFFQHGLTQGQRCSSKQARTLASQIENYCGIGRQLAKSLAKALPDGELNPHWLAQPEDAVRFWQAGRDLHDLRLAAKHTVGIVQSVKQLGRTEINQDENVDINDSINKAVALLQSDLRRVTVKMRPAELPLFHGSQTELVQVWVNIIKNACDAMQDTEQPQVVIQTRLDKKRLLITIANNGPAMNETVRRQIFQPNFTTKKGGLSFGLGLGLSIVKRIITGYGGSIAVKSDNQHTIFRIKLPLED